MEFDSRTHAEAWLFSTLQPGRSQSYSTSDELNVALDATVDDILCQLCRDEGVLGRLLAARYVVDGFDKRAIDTLAEVISHPMLLAVWAYRPSIALAQVALTWILRMTFYCLRRGAQLAPEEVRLLTLLQAPEGQGYTPQQIVETLEGKLAINEVKAALRRLESVALRDGACISLVVEQDGCYWHSREMPTTSAGWLDGDSLEEVVTVAVRCSLVGFESRQLLMQRLPTRFVAGLVELRSPLSQLRADLVRLNHHPRADYLVQWLTTAASLVAHRVEAQLFDDWSHRVKVNVGSR